MQIFKIMNQAGKKREIKIQAEAKF